MGATAPPQHRVLLIEDDAQFAAAVGRLLGPAYEVVHAARAVEGLARFEAGERTIVVGRTAERVFF